MIQPMKVTPVCFERIDISLVAAGRIT
jgi:hypothetical protein